MIQYYRWDVCVDSFRTLILVGVRTQCCSSRLHESDDILVDRLSHTVVADDYILFRAKIASLSANDVSDDVPVPTLDASWDLYSILNATL